MGDRAVLVVTDGEQVSPMIYLHNDAHNVPAIIERLKARMMECTGDVAYAAARLVQEATNGDSGCLSFGIWNTDDNVAAAVLAGDATVLDKESHGDGGFVVIDCRDFSWKAYRGYLAHEAPKVATA